MLLERSKHRVRHLNETPPQPLYLPTSCAVNWAFVLRRRIYLFEIHDQSFKSNEEAVLACLGDSQGAFNVGGSPSI